MPIKSWSVSNRCLSCPPARHVEWSHRFASFRILRSKEGDDRLSSVIFTDGSPGQSTALTKPCRHLALIARGGVMLRCRNGFAALRHMVGGAGGIELLRLLIWRGNRPRRSRDGLNFLGRPGFARGRLRVIRLRAAWWPGAPQRLWRPALPGGASRGVRLRPCRSAQSPALRRAR